MAWPCCLPDELPAQGGSGWRRAHDHGGTALGGWRNKALPCRPEPSPDHRMDDGPVTVRLAAPSPKVTPCPLPKVTPCPRISSTAGPHASRQPRAPRPPARTGSPPPYSSRLSFIAARLAG